MESEVLMTNEEIKAFLISWQDEEYRNFNSRLIPNVNKETVIGVRVPVIRKFAKQLVRENNYASFLKDLPHNLFEENCLHSLIVSELKDPTQVIECLNDFLPYVDNWAVCDIISPRVFIKNKTELLEQIHIWLKSKHTYALRYAIGALMQYFLDDDFKDEYLDLVVNVKSDEYYVNMMRAWYFATAVAKQYNSTIRVFESGAIDEWTHNKAIQKSSESFRVSSDHKAYLKSLKRK